MPSRKEQQRIDEENAMLVGAFFNGDDDEAARLVQFAEKSASTAMKELHCRIRLVERMLGTGRDGK